MHVFGRPAGFFATPRLTGLAACAVIAAQLPSHAATPAPFLKPADALKTFQLEAGLRIELVAAEPLVVDPVAFAFDDNGRLYVVENRGYPGTVKSNQAQADPAVTPQGVIARLEDTDGDGRYDKRTEFATGLTYPNGIAIWRGGVFVTCAPDILYLKDKDGDGVADEKTVVLTGFETTRTTQLRVSHPTLGLDGKFYVTSGLNAGKVTSPLHPEREPVTFTPSDGRFDPTTFAYERTGGRGQFGLTFDAFGRRFICANRQPIMQVVLEPWHLKRNPHLAFTDTSQEVSKVEAQAKVFPISRAVITADFMPALMSKPHAGTFTSACAVLVFGGSALQPEHVGNAFICEPAQNLVQRQVMRAEGASFRADLPYEGREFLASTDTWFRPVFLGAGPDGALYLADMNRREIDHPQYVPEEARGRLDFESGKGTGRIYRIVRADKKSGPVFTKPGSESVGDIVQRLDSPDGWWRARSHRLLLERNDAAAAPLLEKLAGSTARAETRAAALWTLQALHKLTPATIRRALSDASAGVREQAIALATLTFAQAPDLMGAVIEKAADADARVRFIAALALGSVEDPRAVPALAAIAARDGTDRWTRAAVLSGIGDRMDAFLTTLTAAPKTNTAAYATVMEDLARCFGAGAPIESSRKFLATLLDRDSDLTWRLPSVLGLADGLRGRREFKEKAGVNPLTQLANPEALNAFIKDCVTVATDERAPARQRVSAIALLGSNFDQASTVLGSLLAARHPPEIQIQAIRALDRLGDPRGAELLVREANWSRYTASVREAVVATLTSKPAMIEVLFEAIRKGVVKAPEISSLRRTQLQKHTDPSIRKTAETLFQELESGDRMKVYRALRDALAQPAKPAEGAAVFARVCAACHTFHGTGGKVGPDLSGVRNQPADALLLHIIVPNYEVVPAYQTITVATDDGRNLAGWLASETETSLTLRTAAGAEENLLRKNITSLTASGLSLMPDGLEQAMTKDELVNLIAYLKQER
jgi:putative membrane-bound dehydrogenase-like protein